MISRILRKLRRGFRLTITVQVTKRKPTDHDTRKTEMCHRLANETGRTWPPEPKVKC